MSYTSRSGAMGSAEVVTGNIEFYTLFTTLDITQHFQNLFDYYRYNRRFV